MKKEPSPRYMGVIRALLVLFIALTLVTPAFGDIFGVLFTMNVLSQRGTSYSITVRYGNGTLPEGTELVAREITGEEYEQYYDKIKYSVREIITLSLSCGLSFLLVAVG